MLFIDVTYNFTTITGQIVAVWSNNAQPNAEVGRFVIDGTTVQKQGTFRAENLQSAVYQFRYYESSDGVALDALLMPPDYVKAGAVDFAVAIYHYLVDRGNTEGTQGTGDFWADPATDSDTLIDERLKGATVDDIEVQIRGIESLSPDEFEVLPEGGIKLLNGLVFIENNPANIKHFRKIERATASGASAGESFQPVIESAALPASSYFKNNFASFAGVVTLTFPSFSLIPEGTWMKFSTYNLLNGSQLVLQFASGNSIAFAGSNRNRIVLGACEELSLYFYLDAGVIKGLAFNGSACAIGYAKAGQVIAGTQVLLNTLLANAAAPAFNQADYPRLIDSLPAAMIVPVGTALGQYSFSEDKVLYDKTYTYYPNRQKFGFDNAAGTFRLPVLTDLYMKYGDSTSGAFDRFSTGVGSLQWNDILEHSHLLNTNGSSTNGADPPRSIRRLNTFPDPAEGSKPLMLSTGARKVNVDNFLNLPLIGI